MRIGILTQYYPPEIGAPQARLSKIAKHLVERGHEVYVLTAMPSYPIGKIYYGYGGFFRRERMDGANIIRTYAYPTKSVGMLPRLTNYFSFMITSFFVGLTTLPRLDYLITESPPLFLGITGFLLSRLKGAKSIFNVSDLWPESAIHLGVVKKGLALKLSWLLEAFCYKTAFMVVCQSQEILENIRKRFSRLQLYHLPNSVDTYQYRPDCATAEAYSLLDKHQKTLAVFAGLHGLAQGLDQVLAVAEKLKDENGLEFRLIGDGPEKKKLIEQAKNRNLKNVRFLEAVPNQLVPKLLASADILIVPIRGYIPGMVPAKLYEAMATGKAIILVAEGEPAQIVTKHHCGIVVKPGDIDGLAKAFQMLRDNSEMRTKLGEAARHAAVNYYDSTYIIDRFIAQLEGSFDKILEPDISFKELRRIQDVYSQRAVEIPEEFYSLRHMSNLFLYTQRVRALMDLLKQEGMSELSNKKILDVGCGYGDWLVDFESWGAEQAHLHGIDLDENRINKAKGRLSRADLRIGSALSIPWPDEYFDIILQSTLFTSILEDALKIEIARRMVKLLKPNGLIIWYDFCFNNPTNPNVRGINKFEIHSLFPECTIRLRRVTLAPPIARYLVPKSWLLSYMLERTRIFNTHYLGSIRKRTGL